VDVSANGSTYTFTGLPTDTIVKRFKIVTTLATPTKIDVPNADNTNLKVFSSQRTVFVDNGTENSGYLWLYDIAGRLAGKYPFAANKINTIHTDLIPGTYLAKAISRNMEVSERILIH
jgi:hypothetical protein